MNVLALGKLVSIRTELYSLYPENEAVVRAVCGDGVDII